MTIFAILRSKFVRTIIAMMVAVQFINLSIDAVDPTSIEDLSINEIESCLELVVEVVLDHGNAIAETDDNDDSTHKPSAGILLFSVSNLSLSFKSDFKILTQKKSFYSLQFKSLCQSVTSPPPKFV